MDLETAIDKPLMTRIEMWKQLMKATEASHAICPLCGDELSFCFCRAAIAQTILKDIIYGRETYNNGNLRSQN